MCHLVISKALNPGPLPLVRPPLPFPCLPPAFLGSTAVWKWEHRGPFRRSPVLLQSQYPPSLRREAGWCGKDRRACGSSLDLIARLLEYVFRMSPLAFRDSACLCEGPHHDDGCATSAVPMQWPDDVRDILALGVSACAPAGMQRWEREGPCYTERSSFCCITPGLTGPLFLFSLTKEFFFF